jgi:hypothetical protein
MMALTAGGVRFEDTRPWMIAFPMPDQIRCIAASTHYRC